MPHSMVQSFDGFKLWPNCGKAVEVCDWRRVFEVCILAQATACHTALLPGSHKVSSFYHVLLCHGSSASPRAHSNAIIKPWTETRSQNKSFLLRFSQVFVTVMKSLANTISKPSGKEQQESKPHNSVWCMRLRTPFCLHYEPGAFLWKCSLSMGMTRPLQSGLKHESQLKRDASDPYSLHSAVNCSSNTLDLSRLLFWIHIFRFCSEYFDLVLRCQ
jgi:hypothetical protein